MTRISFDISPELHQQFKLYCAERKTTITLEVTKFIDKALSESRQPEQGIKEPQKTVVVDGKAAVDDDDIDTPPFLKSESKLIPEKAIPILEELHTTLEKAASNARMEKLEEAFEGLVQWRSEFRVWQDSKFAEVDEKFSDADHKFVVAGKLIDSLMVFLEKQMGAKKCVDDVKGIAFLKGEGVVNGKTLELH